MDKNKSKISPKNDSGSIKLLLEERVTKIECTPPPELETREIPDPYVELMNLAHVDNIADVGKKGPVYASRTGKEDKKTPGQGLFEALFGRDSLQVAMDIKDKFPLLLRSTVLKLAELQGTHDETYSEEENGRIIHEFRVPEDPIAQDLHKNNGWNFPYYGCVDTTPQFIKAVVEVTKEDAQFLNVKYLDKDGNEKTIADALNSAMDWLIGRMNSNPEGLLEFKPKFKGSHGNQSWRDSLDSYHHADGSLANHDQGIADVEIQALAYDALLDVADLKEKFIIVQGTGSTQANQIKGNINILRERARSLKSTILKEFWFQDDKGKGYFVLGTDRDPHGKIRQLRVKTSQMGHLLDTRILEGNEAEITTKREEVIRTLFSPELLNVSGIRSLASDEVRFRPGAYHNGSVWLWDTGKIAQGLWRHGYYGLSLKLSDKVLNVVNNQQAYVEFARGDSGDKPSINAHIIDIKDEINNRINRVEQPPQMTQAWTVSTVIREKIRREELLQSHGPYMAIDVEKRRFEKEILDTLN